MIVFHGTTKAQCLEFIQNGIDGHKLSPRNIHGPQDEVPGLFVTPCFKTAKQFGRCVISIEVGIEDLDVPPIMKLTGVDILAAMTNSVEPQALLSKRIDPGQIKLVHCDRD